MARVRNTIFEKMRTTIRKAGDFWRAIHRSAFGLIPTLLVICFVFDGWAVRTFVAPVVLVLAILAAATYISEMLRGRE